MGTRGGTIAAGMLAWALLVPPAAALPPGAPPPDGIVDGRCPQDPMEILYVDRARIADVHLDAVDCLGDLRVMLGIPRAPAAPAFQPMATTRRSQAAALVIRALRAAGHELPQPAAEPFDDVPAVHPLAGTIATAAELGLVLGRAERTFDPAAPVTRGEMASLILRARAWSASDTGPTVTPDELAIPDGPFADVPTDGTHAGAINANFDVGLVNGITVDRFAPNAPISRQDAAAMIARFLDTIFVLDQPCRGEAFQIRIPAAWWAGDDCTVVHTSAVLPEPPLSPELELEVDRASTLDEQRVGRAPSETVTDLRETTVAGRPALVLTVEIDGTGSQAPGTDHRYVVSLPDGGVLLAGTDDLRPNPVASRETLDAVMRTLATR